MIVRRHDTGRFAHITPAVASYAQHQAAAAALAAARLRLPGLPEGIRTAWFEDVTNSGLDGMYDRKGWPSTLWLWCGLPPERIAHTTGHELAHLWSARRGFDLSEEDCDAFADGSGEPVMRAILANQTIRITTT